MRPNKNNNLVFGNGVDEENLQLGGRKFIFLIDFPQLFSFLQ